MKTGKMKYIRFVVLGLLLLGVFLFRYIPGAGEQYALHVYPVVSLILSLFSSLLPFSLDEIIVILFVFLLLLGLVFAIYRRIGFRRTSFAFIEALFWMYVWFYWGWGMNYYRDNIYKRASVRPQEYDEMAFKSFLTDYTSRLNALYMPISEMGFDMLEREIKKGYSMVSDIYALTEPKHFQHPKLSFCNSLYSSVGVLGFMGPFFDESHLNHQLLPAQLPFTYAHELSHLLGVSNEAEANWWAFKVCTNSSVSSIRFCGYYGIFGYVIKNARRLLSKEDYSVWLTTVRGEVKDDFLAQQRFWNEKYSKTLGNLQDVIYDLFLKSNKIKSGRQNYAEVIGIIMSLPDNCWR